MVNFFKAYFLYRAIAKNYERYGEIIDEQIESYEKRQYPPESLGAEIESIKEKYLNFLLGMRNTVELVKTVERKFNYGKSKKTAFAKIRYFRSEIRRIECTVQAIRRMDEENSNDLPY